MEKRIEEGSRVQGSGFRASVWVPLFILSSILYSQPATQAQDLPSTPYTRTVLRAATDAAARSTLGIANSNWAFNAGQFGNAINESLTIKSGVPLTNVTAYGLLSATGPVTGESNQNVLYVRPDGNNATAVRGNPRFPWATLSNALLSAISGDVVQLEAGVHTFGNGKRFRVNNDYLGCNAWIHHTNLVIRGRGDNTILSNTYAASTGLLIQESDGITLEDLRLTSWHPNTNELAANFSFGAIEVSDSRNLLIQRVTFDHLMNFCYVTSGSNSQSTNVIIRNCIVKACPGMWVGPAQNRWDGGGFAVDSDTTVQDCYFEDVNVAVEPYDGHFVGTLRTICNVFIRNNTVRGARWALGTSYSYDRSVLVTNMVVQGNTLYCPQTWVSVLGSNMLTATPIEFHQASGLVIQNNTVIGGGYGGIWAWGLTNAHITGNTIIGVTASSGSAIMLNSAGTDQNKNVVVRNNTVINCSGGGIAAGRCKALTIAGNDMRNIDTGNAGYYGLYVTAVTNANVAQNYVEAGNACNGFAAVDCGSTNWARGNIFVGTANNMSGNSTNIFAVSADDAR
jgi:hypothetical protein